jgi:hypothetical protein
MDAHKLGNKILDLWRQEFRDAMTSGTCEPGSVADIGLYVDTPYGVYKLDDVSIDPEFGIMLNVKIKEYKADCEKE